MIKKILKIIVITITSMILIYTLFIIIEKSRFNNNPVTKPLIIVKESKIEIIDENNKILKKYIGLGYTMEYEYIIISEENNLKEIPLSAEFKLFGKIRLSAWIQ